MDETVSQIPSFFFLKKKILLKCVYIVHWCRCLQSLEVLDPRELEFQAVVSRPKWVLGA